MIIHHQRRGGDIVTHIVSDGAVMFDPPGMEVGAAEVCAGAYS